MILSVPRHHNHRHRRRRCERAIAIDAARPARAPVIRRSIHLFYSLLSRPTQAARVRVQPSRTNVTVAGRAGPSLRHLDATCASRLTCRPARRGARSKVIRIMNLFRFLPARARLPSGSRAAPLVQLPSERPRGTLAAWQRTLSLPGGRRASASQLAGGARAAARNQRERICWSAIASCTTRRLAGLPLS